ncbi:hypothetical protein [Neobacillus sp. D3-1R]|uniref:hypothetical protein n=1 Tax=Neobacillus sp. D3-1R TaxID=3445778 RepID=UPI003F9F56B2
MIRLKDAVEELDEIALNLQFLQGHYYEDQHFFNEKDLETLRDHLQLFSERFSSAYIYQDLELIDYGTIIEKLVSLKEVDYQDLEHDGILNPDTVDVGSFITTITEERYSALFFEAQPHLNELRFCINKILIL